ncbi:MAG TPA: hypothetical protein PK156_14685 [Polyangium sp.]|nr:hypothetical protein [Polyangium sp.]
MSTSESSTQVGAQHNAAQDRRRRQTKRWFVAASLIRARMGQTRLSRVGSALAMGVAVSIVVFAIFLRASDGASAPLDGLLEMGAGLIACVAAFPTTLAAATDRRTLDREAGIEALVTMRGVHVAQLELVRVYAAMMLIARATAIPLLTIALVITALASNGAIVLGRLGVALGLVMFAAMVGVVLGSVATFSARVGGRRGKLLASAIVFLPWILGEAFGRGIYSIPGALDAALSLIIEVAYQGAGA